jgi:hypothetical protein
MPMSDFKVALIAAVTLSIGTTFAQAQTVDPSKVAPEFRAAAIRRAAEQHKLLVCQKEAQEQKLLPRYRTKFLTACMEK